MNYLTKVNNFSSAYSTCCYETTQPTEQKVKAPQSKINVQIALIKRSTLVWLIKVIYNEINWWKPPTTLVVCFALHHDKVKRKQWMETQLESFCAGQVNCGPAS